MIALDHFYGARILNLAHRGASGHAPQNTLAAFLLAAEMGADGIELDVHLSADNEVVVIHDDTVDGTTDGHGRVSRMRLSELKRLDAGAWFDQRFAGERIPTLQEVFDAVGHLLVINIEIKAERDHHPPAQEAEVVRLIEDNQMVHRVLISSFAPSSLRRVRKMNPHIPLGFLYARPEPLFLPRLLRWLSVPYDALHPSMGLVTRRYMDSARRQGQRVNVWTVNTRQDMRRMRDLGVDGIITNYPDLLRDVLAES
jgi:glycerophosphoryl diester phosphodiesterase